MVGKLRFNFEIEYNFNGRLELIAINNVTFADNGTYSCTGFGESSFISYADLYVGSN